MHLVINATEMGRRRGGNESYIAGLLEGLVQCAAQGVAQGVARPEVSLLTCRWDPAPVFPSLFRQINLGIYQQLPFYLWQQTRALRRLRPDWYLSTFFLPPMTPCRAAVLVHDMSFRAHPEYFPRFIALYMRVLTGLAVRRAERVIALSEFTRREIVRFHPAAAAKTVVVLPGIDPAFQPAPGHADGATLAAYGLTPGYILALGNIHPRKNLARLLDAYRLLQESGGAPPMVWAGLQRWDSAPLLERARAAGVLLPGFIAQADLPALYRQAAVLVYPSLYEGFGLPPVEALACGAPVIAANTTSLPEAVGDAALLVDPLATEALAGALAQVLGDAALRARLRQAGLAHVQRFLWRQTAQHLLAHLEN